MTVFGYARVSTDGQTLAAQDAALRGSGCAKVFSETASGAKTDRAALRKAIAALREGDTLVVTRLDRLARSTRDLLNVLDEIAKRGVASHAHRVSTRPRARLCHASPPERAAATFRKPPAQPSERLLNGALFTTQFKI
jgi:DNA invertase Pin-like site-specific DNA recombinase